jgi:hypothetical protein
MSDALSGDISFVDFGHDDAAAKTVSRLGSFSIVIPLFHWIVFRVPGAMRVLRRLG